MAEPILPTAAIVRFLETADWMRASYNAVSVWMPDEDPEGAGVLVPEGAGVKEGACLAPLRHAMRALVKALVASGVSVDARYAELWALSASEFEDFRETIQLQCGIAPVRPVLRCIRGGQ